MNTSNQGGGRGSNLTEEDRRKGGEHSHMGKNNANKGGRGSNLTQEDRKKGGQHSHDNKR